MGPGGRAWQHNPPAPGIRFFPLKLFQRLHLAAGQSQDTKRWYQYLREGIFPPKLRDNPSVPLLISPVSRNVTNNGSSFSYKAFGCQRAELPEAGEGDTGFPVILLHPMDGCWQFPCSLEHVGAKWVTIQKIFCSCSGYKEDNPAPQHSNVGLEETIHLFFSSCPQRRWDPEGGTGETSFPLCHDPQGFHPVLDDLSIFST